MISELKLDLLKEGHSFSFFQVMRLLRLLHRDPANEKSTDASGQDPIWVRPNLSLAFPKADVETIEEKSDGEDERFEVQANFLGLYGASSPLPVFYTEDLIDETADDESVAREFIDVINQRLFQLFYDCCTKYQQAFKVVEEGSRQHAERLFCLLGIGDEEIRSQIPDPYSMIRYLGLFTQMPRSALGLETLLKDVLKGKDVSVIPCLERKAKIPVDQKLRLGSSAHRLGNNCILGEEVSDRMGKFRVQIGPLDKEEFRGFYPGSDIYKRVTLLMNMYVLGSLEYDMEVILAKGQAQTVCLGDPARSEVGLNSWIFAGDRIGELRTLYRPMAKGSLNKM
ncbi:MAG: type VI secretion system baseplate subunit TssG [Desulfobacteraceae bacterium]|nr:type VI secretion system baseplate subunit TssG [Desulfobacteraceae bacterium]MBC2754356.1 type VI secretion system baseplate subunit TssG [Desulfobacteraceae bacterium]